MISPALTTLGNELQQAAARRSYDRVPQLAAQLGARAAEEARGLPRGDVRFGELAEWLKQVYESTEILVRIGRASQADQFRRLVFLKKYLPEPAPIRATHLRIQL
jgi:hypothetical protein